MPHWHLQRDEDLVKPPPIIDHDTIDPPVFAPANLPDGARRQKGLPEGRCPAACLLDRDGELVERLATSGRAWQALGKPVTCIAHVTNAMATRPDDFEKGGREGQEDALEVGQRALMAALAYTCGLAKRNPRRP